MKIIVELFEGIADIFFPGPLILIPFIIIVGGPLLIILCRRGEMSSRWGWRLFFGSLALTSLAGYIYLDIRYPTYSWRQKLTIEVETPDGTVTGSSVVAVKWETVRPVPLTTAAPAQSNVQGEATIITLPDGRYLFALLRGADVLALHSFAEDKINHRYHDSQARFLPAAADVSGFRRTTKELQQGNYPMLVTFTDIKNPVSVKEVDPSNLAEWFGPGVSLKSISLTISNEPMTNAKIEQVISWLSEYKNKQFDGYNYKYLYARNRFANSINIIDFKRGN